MRSKTKIIVLHMKELIYTGIFVILGILFLVLLILMFFPSKKSEQKNDATETMAYVPGVYTTSLVLGQNAVELEVVLDENNINSIRLVNLNEAVTTMYPLIQPSFDDLVNQIYAGQPLDQISFSDENRYTSSVLLNAIRTTLEKATVPGDTDVQNESPDNAPETIVPSESEVQPEVQPDAQMPADSEIQSGAETSTPADTQPSAENPTNSENPADTETPSNTETPADTKTSETESSIDAETFLPQI